MKRREKIRIEVVDDHPVVREGLVAIINQCEDMEVVAEAANGKEAITQFEEYHPDLVLMDLRMPEVDGVTAIREIMRVNPNARITVLTTYGTDHDIQRAFEAGARGYLLKGNPKQTLLDAIRATFESEQKQVVPPELIVKLVEGVREPRLSARELVVLGCVADGKSNAEIAYRLGIEEGTVKVHVHKILFKLGAKSRAEAISTALKKGIVFFPEPGSSSTP